MYLQQITIACDSLTHISNDKTGNGDAEWEFGVIYGSIEHVHPVEHVREVFLQVDLGLVILSRLSACPACLVESDEETIFQNPS